MIEGHVSKGVRVRVPYCALGASSAHLKILYAWDGRTLIICPLCPISLMDRACGYGPQYERPIRSWGTVVLAKETRKN